MAAEAALKRRVQIERGFNSLLEGEAAEQQAAREAAEQQLRKHRAARLALKQQLAEVRAAKRSVEKQLRAWKNSMLLYMGAAEHQLEEHWAAMEVAEQQVALLAAGRWRKRKTESTERRIQVRACVRQLL